MRVLIAGEFSGRVRDAFIRRGHEAVSVDYRETEAPGPHIVGSWFEHATVNKGWDLLIAHPDCTFLVVSGARWMSVEWREEAQLAALHTVKSLWKFPIQKIAIENPVGKLSSLWRAPDQIVQPFHFGDPYRKATCLWLKNLPALVPTSELQTGAQACWKEPPGVERKKNRARTYPGMAEAMAAQWGGTEARDTCPLCDGDGFNGRLTHGAGANCLMCGGAGKVTAADVNADVGKRRTLS